jgi:MSHA biogenesis protein MshJ
MVAPNEVPELLEGVLARNPRIEMLSMTKLAPVAMSSDTDPSPPKGVKTGGSPGEGIFRHTIELSLAGSYNDLLNYVSALERLPQRLMWTSANIKVERYPRTVMVLRVYTLSFDNNWLQL